MDCSYVGRRERGFIAHITICMHIAYNSRFVYDCVCLVSVKTYIRYAILMPFVHEMCLRLFQLDRDVTQLSVLMLYPIIVEA
jgi:hypothetical protein